MNKKRGFLTFLLFVLTIAFIAFVIIMQHNFVNPDFATAETNENIDLDDKKDSDGDKVKSKDTEKLDKEEEVSAEKSQNKTEPAKKYVNVDLLNVRSDPNTDSEIVGVVTLKQEVVAENVDNDEGWVKITTDDFTGYVNGKYLDEEV
ncbi:SH3 domain-containing protein [Oceanobacillus sp. Castelsardo]|uniref:SH3 domain-containing protein n=1 Tax=Oceanobacillus sp. Castelsardo TaxID=1851204 RepID=UPI000838D922|nr:SH3 domain-containing protein [Oceanobacillus sp. Castelsardo]